MKFSINIVKKVRTEEGDRELHYILDIDKEECLGVAGPSGSGKSCLLKMIAGLITPENGSICAGTHPWFDKTQRINLIPQKRDCGYMHQNPVIFPFLSVEKNIHYAAKDHEQADAYINILGLEELRKYTPKYLSGGQEKRAALAQILAFEPSLLLLDEPFAFLDRTWIEIMTDILSHYQYKKKGTMVIVSHQHNILAGLCDRIIRITPGGLRTVGYPNHFQCRKQKEAVLYFSRPFHPVS
jgi:molybdate transport system ATP-binding protein